MTGPSDRSTAPVPELLPTRTSYRPDQAVEIELRNAAGPATLTLWRLGELLAQQSVPASSPVSFSRTVSFGMLEPGGYGIELTAADVIIARTAVEVVSDARSVLRYGFVVDFRPDRDVAPVSDNLRRLHLTGVQFYDWAYRHADLLGGGAVYTDALGQPVSLDTVRALIETCHQVGSDALGYAAVYAVGPDEWPKWEHDALLTATGEPYALGDFLFILDPARRDWLEHFGADLTAATEQVGFDGFHLDQYGYPKRAHRPDGELVDVADSFRTLIAGVREALPQSRLVFNNVNDFPTWVTAGSPQDAVYVEVWPPQVGLEHLASVATRARAEAGGKPVVIAAYQHLYDTADAESANRATALTMATLWSHGASHLLCGEADRILVDPYYVRNHPVAASTAELLRRWYDFSVEHAELLSPVGIDDVTASFAGAYNDDLDVSYSTTAVRNQASAGTVWRRITSVHKDATDRRQDRLVMHLINLARQDDTLWDAARHEPADPGPGTLRIRRVGPGLPRVRYADPDRQSRLIEVPVTAAGNFATAHLPAPYLWQLVVIDHPSIP